MNPDEMETQVFAGPTVLPDAPPPKQLVPILAAIQLRPPEVNPTMQLKQNFKSMLDSKNKTPDQGPSIVKNNRVSSKS